MQFSCVNVIFVYLPLNNSTEIMELAANNSDFKTHSRVDRVGILASILCAIHCALTPVFLILLPTFGKAWAHPSNHWGMALIVIPIAIFMMRKGYNKHGRKWVIIAGVAGISFIIVGAILPYVEAGQPSSGSSSTATTAAPEKCTSTAPG